MPSLLTASNIKLFAYIKGFQIFLHIFPNLHFSISTFRMHIEISNFLLSSRTGATDLNIIKELVMSCCIHFKFVTNEKIYNKMYLVFFHCPVFTFDNETYL